MRWLLASIAFWGAAMCLLVYVLWRTSARRSWRRLCPSFVEWVALTVESQSPESASPEKIEETVALLLDDVTPGKVPAPAMRLTSPHPAGVRWR